MRPRGAVVAEVAPGSPAERAGLAPGDEVLQVEGRRPRDLMQVLESATRGRVELRVRRGVEEFDRVVVCAGDEALGLTFEDLIFDRVKTCRNKCVFCFMDQMPRHMRASLYYRDDDFRLSTLHGNFITLTNLAPEEWERILTQRVSPLYVSVHATDPELRTRLLGNTRRASMDIMEALRRLAEAGITLHTQIVLCPGLNDGDHLERSLEDLSSLYPAVRSVAVVPVGLTRYRARLPELRPVTREMVSGLVAQVGRFQQRNRRRWGEPVVWLADEIYLIGGLPFPPHSHYRDYPQLENGVGMVRRFLVDFNRRRQHLPRKLPRRTRWLLVTGEYGALIFPPLVDDLQRRVENLEIRLHPVSNEFFGPLVKCSGLLTGRDLLRSLEREREWFCGPGITRIMVPGNALKDAAVMNRCSDLFLDDVELAALADRFQVPVVDGGSSCPEWLGALTGRRPRREVRPLRRSRPVHLRPDPARGGAP